MESSGLASSVYFFHGCSVLVEVQGFGHLTSPTNMNQMFVNCFLPETMWADDFYGQMGSGKLMFSRCSRLVGEKGYLSAQTDNHQELHFGATGALARRAQDARAWFRCFLYDGREPVLTTATMPEAGGRRSPLDARAPTRGTAPWGTIRGTTGART